MTRTLLFLATVLLLLAAGAGPPAAQEQGLPGDGGTDAPDEAPAEGATEREVSAELDRAGDRAIAERLRATFAGVEALRGIQVEVMPEWSSSRARFRPPRRASSRASSRGRSRT